MTRKLLNTKRLVDRQLGRNIKHPVLPAGDGFIIPNLSGDHSAGTTGTPATDLDIANKKYVDDNSGGVTDHAFLTNVTANQHHTKYTDAEVDTIVATHTALGNAHHNESHTIASHSDTTATGAELETLTDGSTTTLHNHTAAAPEGTAVLSTGEGGGSKFLREDGDGTSSWQTPAGSGDVTAAQNLTDVKIVQGDGGSKGVKTSTATVGQIASNVTHSSSDGSDHSNVVSNTAASHAQSHTIASHSDTTATGAELETLTGGGDTTLHDHDGISENTTARHNESHTVVSHSDTTATGAELNELTDGSETTLHSHAGGGGSGTVNTIKENNVQVGGADIVILDFLGADFDLTESPDKEIQVVINDAGIDHDATTNFVADEHIDWTAATSNFVTTGTLTAETMFDLRGSNADINLTRSVNSAGGPDWNTLKSRGTIGTKTIVQDGDVIGSFNFRGYDGDEFHIAANIIVTVGGTPGNNDMPGKLTFGTTVDGGTSPTTRLTIFPDGEINIGTSATLGKQALTIDQNDADQAFIDFQGTEDNIVPPASGNITTLHSGGSSEIGDDIAGPKGTSMGMNSGWVHKKMVRIEIGGVEHWIAAYTHEDNEV